MVELRREMVFPDELATDPDQDNLAVYVSETDGMFNSILASPSMVRGFDIIDQLYATDKVAYLGRIAAGLDVLMTKHGPIDTVFLQGPHDAETDEIMLDFSPLNDGRPEAIKELKRFVLKDKSDITARDIKHAQPNSARPLIKLSLAYYFGQTQGLGMPYYQLFAREVPALSHAERRRIMSGDTRPYGRLGGEAFDDAKRRKHEAYGTTGGLKGLHIFTAGMGTKALGAAVEILETRPDIELRSVTIQNTPLNGKKATEQLSNYMESRTVGPASTLVVPPGYGRVEEALILRDIGQKAEPNMRRRQLRAMANLGVLIGLQIRTGQAAGYIEKLLNAGVTMTIVSSLNEAMVEQTEMLIPVSGNRLHRTWIVGVNGKKTGMIANEQGGVIAITNNLGPRNYRQDELAAHAA